MEATDRKELEHKQLKGRLMGKLFGKEKKPSSAEEVSDFLHGPIDKVYTASSTAVSDTPPQLPILDRIDTSTARRWPTAAEVNNARRNRSVSPKRSRKGLAVRFTEAQPEVIGEGGDECASPTAEIAEALRSRAATIPQQRRNASRGPADKLGDPDMFRPGPLRRMQTGFSTTADDDSASDNEPAQPYRNQRGEASYNGNAKTGSRSSFNGKAEAAMRASEGKALVRAVSGHFTERDLALAALTANENSPSAETVQLNTMKNTQLASSPGLPANSFGRPDTPSDSGKSNPPVAEESPSSLSRTFATNNASAFGSPPPQSRAPTFNLKDAAIAVGDDALNDFARRTSHLFTLFRLSAESLKPLTSCSLEELVRGGLWWFLKGRSELESSIRDRSTTPEAKQNNAMARQQAYTNLAKAYWLMEKIAPKCPEMTNQINADNIIDALESRQAILSGLKKLTMSMKRNNILPPLDEDAPLLQGTDSQIWTRDEGDRSLLSLQRPNTTLTLSGALPLGDSGTSFTYGRHFVDVYLLEEADSQHYRCPCVLSIVRANHEEDLSFIITNQSGALKLIIQHDKTRGPTWNDVSWVQKTNSLNVKLPRGFELQVNCTQQDFRSLRGSYDFQNSVRQSLARLEDEDSVFEMTIKAFQCFGQEKQAQSFPAEAVPNCEVRLFEKSIVEKAATGPRKMHRGFRLAVMTGKMTKNLRGIDQDVSPTIPIQFSLLRGDNGYPALLLKLDGGNSRSSMVFTFEEADQRARLHALLTGGVVGREETVYGEAPIRSFIIEEAGGLAPRLGVLEWQSVRIINEDAIDIQNTKTVLSEHLRVIMDFKTGTITDRFNIGPGELKLRLDLHLTNELKILRQPQHDMTIMATQAQTANQPLKEFAEVLGTIARAETTRTYVFPSLKELHLFQTALTGFVVVFDGRASSFSISRRRMVVPIYKKWDASITRLQLVQKEKIIQLLAFFENFSHGDCMGFTLKSTDTFESSSKSGKFSLRIVDAKFSMPKPRGDGQAALDSGFVNLDMPDYPGEHDDITIIFDTEAERDAFTKSLPAPVKVASRIGSVRR
ncbi:a5802913-90ab-4390-8e2f-ab95b417de8b [Sclerotinia trifoliorum]|uniref:A5802913-90ab-4390-8e2f-ab95b417de8b n=1 Tax=Sclerotinia trifoliorum TaxID=28548 RepID=A0A8H2ZQP6_9HELO|nr:a5802913-90ab-4390-8e2f-ab95b417de8b [Sclerotinia trifoliorum]